MKQWWEAFKTNLSYWYQYAQAWAIALWMGAYGFWSSEMVSEETRQAFYTAMPFGLGKYMPFFMLIVAWFTAHGWPQPALEAKIAAKVSPADPPQPVAPPLQG